MTTSSPKRFIHMPGRHDVAAVQWVAVSTNWIGMALSKPILGELVTERIDCLCVVQKSENILSSADNIFIAPGLFQPPPAFLHRQKRWVNSTTCSKFNMEYATRSLFPRGLGYIQPLALLHLPLNNSMSLTGSCEPKVRPRDRVHRIGNSAVMLPSAKNK